VLKSSVVHGQQMRMSVFLSYHLKTTSVVSDVLCANQAPSSPSADMNHVLVVNLEHTAKQLARRDVVIVIEVISQIQRTIQNV
jgi:hydroxypyruvate isomerase